MNQSVRPLAPIVNSITCYCQQPIRDWGGQASTRHVQSFSSYMKALESKIVSYGFVPGLRRPKNGMDLVVIHG